VGALEHDLFLCPFVTHPLWVLSLGLPLGSSLSLFLLFYLFPLGWVFCLLVFARVHHLLIRIKCQDMQNNNITLRIQTTALFLGVVLIGCLNLFHMPSQLTQKRRLWVATNWCIPMGLQLPVVYWNFCYCLRNNGCG
jgi:hypothetical protein